MGEITTQFDLCMGVVDGGSTNMAGILTWAKTNSIYHKTKAGDKKFALTKCSEPEEVW